MNVSYLGDEEQALGDSGADDDDDRLEEIGDVGRLARAQHEDGPKGAQDHHVVDAQPHPAGVVQLRDRHLTQGKTPPTVVRCVVCFACSLYFLTHLRLLFPQT